MNNSPHPEQILSVKQQLMVQFVTVSLQANAEAKDDPKQLLEMSEILADGVINADSFE